MRKHKYVTETVGGTKVFVLVDAFNEDARPFEQRGDVTYVLTHAHADHYTGLQHASWLTPGRRKVVAGEVTARLVNAIVGVPLENFVIVPLNKATEIHPHVRVTLVDANHCPGACMAVFEFSSGRRVLHTGDFRFTPRFKGRYDTLVKGIDEIYLDTTYCHPRFASVPDADAALEALGREVEARARADVQGNTLHLISTYTIGKEKVLEKMAQTTGEKVFVDGRKYELLQISERDMCRYTTNPEEARMRAVKWGTLGETWPYFRPDYKTAAEMARALGHTRVVGWVPTGWVSTSQQRSFVKRYEDIDVEIVLVSYSEHSSFDELKEFVAWVRPRLVVPTVGSDNDRAAAKLQAYFRHMVDEKAGKAAFVARMQRGREITLPTRPEHPEQPASPQEEVVVLLEEAGCDGDGGDNDSGDDVVFVSETSRKASRTKQMKMVQASIKRYSTSLLDNQRRKKPAMEDGDDHESQLPLHAPSPSPSPSAIINVNEVTTRTTPRPSISPAKTPSIVMTGKPAVDKPSADYHPVADAGFTGTRTPYGFLAQAMEMMEGDARRLAKDQILVNVFRTCLAISEEDAVAAVFMILGRVADEHDERDDGDEQDGLELNIGGSTLVRCVADALGVSVDGLKAKYREVGDMGSVAASCKSHQRVLLAPRPMSVSSVFKAFVDIARTTGKGSLNSKKQQIVKILRQATTPAEIKFCVRALVSTMRIGANWRSVLPAFGKAALWNRSERRRSLNALAPSSPSSPSSPSPPSPSSSPFPSDEELAEAAVSAFANYCRHPRIRGCCKAILNAETLHVQVGVPFKPMLARPAGKGVSDALSLIQKSFDANGDALCEWKYDGMRSVIHVDVRKKSMTVYSRNGEDRTSNFDDLPLLEAIADGVTDAILDGEICAIAADGTIDSFQRLAARATNGCSLRLLLFDLVLVNRESLIDEPLERRRTRLRQIIRPSDSVAFADGHVVNVASLTQEDLRGMLLAAVDNKQSRAEGLMIKNMSGTYECMNRSSSWIKLKKDYCEDDQTLSESFDVRVIGAWHGNGRKAGWYSPFLVAVFNEEAETWESLCRVLSGFSNEFYAAATERLSKLVVESKPVDYDTGEAPPVWFETDEVWEIRGADLQISPVHRACAGTFDEYRGLGLRFPRFVRARDDKGLHDVTTASDVAALR